MNYIVLNATWLIRQLRHFYTWGSWRLLDSFLIQTRYDMSSDNWEKRFDAVVKETEEKLARVKGTLSRSASPNVNKYDKYEKYSLKLDLGKSRTQKQVFCVAVTCRYFN